MAKSVKASSLGLLALEPRQMYDGAGALSAAGAARPTLGMPHATTVMHGNPALDHGSREVVFIDGGVPNLSQLVASVETARPGATVAVLDPKGNELSEIAAYVAAMPTLDAIHLISHGAAGQIDLGSAVITDASLGADAATLAAIGRAVKPGGEILFYGCDVAEGSAGGRFIGDLAAATGRVIAASTNDTGAASLGGDWALEAATGARSVTAIDATGFDGLLGAPTITGLTALSYTGTSPADLAHTATSDANPTITGFATPGDSLVIQIDATSQISGSYFTGLTADVTAGPITGFWSYTFQAPLTVGTHSIVVYDATANASSSTYAITIDTPPSIATSVPGQGAYAVVYDQSGTPVPVDSLTLVGENTGVADYSYDGATGVYTGKSFQAQVTAGGSGSDALAFGATPASQGSNPTLDAATQPTALGVVSVSGGFAYLGNGTVAQLIGTVTGTGTSDLVVTFTSNLVTDAVVQALARMVTYSNGFGTVGVPLTPATVTFSLTDNIDSTTQFASSVVNYDNTLGTDSAPVITLSGSSPISVTNGAAQDVDSGLTVTGNAASNIVEANVLIENVQAGDVLGWSASVASTYGMTVSYNSSIGVLQVTSNIGSEAGYQAFLRTVTFSTTSTSTVARTVDISIGAGLYYSQDGHFYEFVADNGVTYQQAEVLASENHLYGLQGYLATITSSQENAFINSVVGGNGWLGANDAPIAYSAAGAPDSLTFGHWHWIDGPEGLLASQSDGLAGLYFFQQNGATVLNGDGSTNPGESGSISGQLYGYRNLSGGSGVGSNFYNWISPGEPNNLTAGPGEGAILPAGAAGGGEEFAHIYSSASGNPGQWNDYSYNAQGGSIAGYVVEFGGIPGDVPQTFGVTKSISVENTVPAPVITGLTAATDTGSSQTDGITSNQSPTVMGTGQPGATITLFNGASFVGSAMVDSSGNWTIPVASTLAAGSYPFTAQETLDSLQSGNSNTYNVVIETSAPAPVITGLTAATDTGSSNTDGITSDTTPTVMGTGEAGDTLTVSDGATVLGTVTVASNGSWTLPVSTPLASGTHDLTAMETDPAGNVSPVSNTYAVTIETSAPAPVITGLTPATDTGSSDTDGITSDTTPTVMGTGEAGDTLTLYEGSTVLGTVTVASNGSWTLPLTTPLSAGTHDLTATETDPAGVTSPISNTYAVTIETSAPAPVITGLTASTDTGSSDTDGITSDTTPTVMGTGEAGDTLTLYEGSTVLGTVTVASNGSWTLPLTTPLSAGTHDLTATETDPAGVTSPISNTYAVTIETSAPAPVITGLTASTDTGSSDTDGITSDTTPTVMGTGEAGDTLTLYEGSTVLGTVTVASNGSWTLPLTTPLSAGTHDLTATETDPAGVTSPVSNTYAVTIETSAPAPVITGLTASTDTGSSDTDGITSDTTPTVMGTGEAGDTLTLYEGSTVLGTTTVGSNGSWTLPLTTALAVGTHDLTATETDPAGVTSPVSNTYAVTIETSASAPVIIGLTPATDTGSSDTDGITSDTTPTVMGTGEVGDTLTLYEGSTVLGTTAVASNGSWTLPLTTALAAGTHDLTATETDPAGNVSPVSNTYPVVIETSAPAPVITGLTAATDTGGSDTDGITSDTTPTVMGTGEAGDTLTLYEGSTVLGTTTVGSNGSWTLPLTTALAAGTHDLTATETDPAGVTSPVSNTYAVTIETSASAPVIIGLTPATDTGSSDTDGITSDTTPTVMGTGEAGDTLTLYEGSTVLGTVTVASNGSWMLPVSTPLAAGTHNLTATETDPAGVTSPVSNTYAVTIETSAPAPVITGLTAATDTGNSDTDGITSDTTPTVMGTGEAGDTLTLYEGSTVLGTVTVGSNGSWTLPLTTPLSVGTHDLTATETDPAGVTSPVSNTYAVTIETSAPAPVITGLTAATDTGNSDTDGITSDTTPTVMGTGEAGDTLTLYEGSTVLGTVMVGSNGSWTLPLTTPLSVGTHDLTATETDPAGVTSPVSNTYAVTIETSAPAPVITGLTAATDTGNSDTDGITSDTTPTVMGTGEAGDTLTLYEGSTVLGTVTVGSNGSWTLPLTRPLSVGTHDLTATETDPAGVTSPLSNTYAVTIETSAPAPVITGLTAATDTGSSDTDGITSDTTPTVMGTGEAGDTLTLFEGSTVLGTVTVASNGSWTLPLTTALTVGTHDLTATETDPAGVTSPLSNTYAVTIETSAPAPVITGLTAATDTGSSDTDGITSDTTPTLMGTGEAGDKLTLYEGSTVLGTVTVASNGNWTLPLTTALTVGTHDLTATETDPAGVTSPLSNTYAVKIETSAPAPVISGLTAATDTGSSDTDGITSDTTPTVVGTGQAGDAVTVSDGATVLGTATVAANGSWTLTVSTALTAGTHDLTATETDPAGNLSPISNTYAVTVETSAPAPVIGGLTAATDTGSSDSDGITGNTTPTVMGTGEAGDTVTVLDGTTVLGTVTVASNGSWTLPLTTALADGTHDLTATETDPAGVTSPVSNTYAVVIETSAPAPVITGLTAATDTGRSDTDGITSDTTPTVMGTGEAGDSVTVSDGTTVLGTATVSSNGNWTLALTTPLTPGTHDLTATETDPAGNLSPVSNTYAVTVETSAPAPVVTGLTPATDTGPSDSDGITSDATPTVMGTGEAGAVVTVFDGTSVLGTANVAANGSWLLPVTTPLADGTHALTATETDPARNLSPASAPYDVTVVMAPPTPAISGLTPATDTGSSQTDGITSDTTPVVTGAGEAGDSLTLYDGTTVLGTVTVAANGSWTLPVATPLAPGMHELTTIQTNLAGYPSAASAPLQVVIETSAPAPVISGLTPATDTGVSQTDGITSDTTPTLMGTGEAGAVVTVSDGTTVLGSATVAANGTWLLALTAPLASGTHDLTATETDQAGNQSPVSASYAVMIETSAPAPVLSGLTPATDTGSSDTDGITSDTTPTLMGTGEPGAVVTLYDSTAVIGTATVAANGSWTLALTAPLAAGQHELIATETDAAGNVSPASAPLAVTIETSAPAPVLTGLTPATDTGRSQTDGITSDTTPVLMGTGEAGATVTLYEGTTVLGTTVVGANGSWTLALTTPLVAGTHELTATETDAAGNVSPASAPLAVTIETSAPAPAITGLTPAAVDGVTGDPTPTVMGIGEPGAVVTLFDGTREIGMAIVGANGTWSFAITTPLADGLHDLSATETDAAGNASPPSSPFAVTVDRLSPARPVIIGITPGTDTGIVGDGLTSDRLPALIGTASPGSLVTIYDGSTAIGTTTANAAGMWSFTPASGLTDGLHSLSAIATDPAGVTSPRSAINALEIVPTTLGPIAAQTWLGAGAQRLAVPGDVFSVPSGDTPVYAARLVTADGAPVGPLPSWMQFDPATGVFTGAVPTGVNGVFHIEVTLTDNHGDSASAIFVLTYEGPSPTQVALMAGPAPIAPPVPVPVVPPLSVAAALPDQAAPGAATPVQDAESVVPLLTPVEDSLTAVKPLTEVSVSSGARVRYTLAAETFEASDPTAPLTLSASLANGQPLPSWLVFDPQSGTLSGLIPAQYGSDFCEQTHAAGKAVLDVVITARDSTGHAAYAHVRLKLPRSPAEGCAMQAHHRHADLSTDRPLRLLAAGRDDAAPNLLPGHGRDPARPGLSAQIRASHPGARLLSQAAFLRAAERMLHRL